jgi:hypothetical protein
MKYRKQQQMKLNSLLRRIQRDRDEQLIHRQTDSRLLIQRNKNMIADIMERQQVESKNTIAFLKYALGRRAPKEEDHSNSPVRNFQYTDLSQSQLNTVDTTQVIFRRPKASLVNLAVNPYGDNFRKPSDFIRGKRSIERDMSKMESISDARSRQNQTMTMESREKVTFPEIMAYNASRLGMKNLSIVTSSMAKHLNHSNARSKSTLLQPK